MSESNVVLRITGGARYQKRLASEWQWAQLGNFCRKFTSDENTGCWIWWSADKDGYGRYLGEAAHRWAYHELVGPIPAGWTVDHLCGTTLCVNPDHLDVCTVQENSARAVSRRRLSLTASWPPRRMDS